MSEFDPIAFGRLSEKVDGLVEDMKEIKLTLKEVSDTLQRQKGARWAFGTMIALISSSTTYTLHRWFL